MTVAVIDVHAHVVFMALNGTAVGATHRVSGRQFETGSTLLSDR